MQDIGIYSTQIYSAGAANTKNDINLIKLHRDGVDSGDLTAYQAATTFGQLGDITKCLDQAEMVDMWRAFPSGHTSLSFSSMVYTHFVLVKILRIEKGVYFGLKSLFATIPLLICTWISATRIIDFKVNFCLLFFRCLSYPF
jgi:PAP2 superfamily